MPEFFLELFSEEIPARMQQLAARQLSILTTGYLQDIVLRGTQTNEFFGPRRVAVAFEVQSKVSSVFTKQRGPRSNAPDAAIEGFLRKQGGTRQNLQIEDDYFILSTHTPERSARQVIQEKLPEHLKTFPWPKSMRWGESGEFTWIRPLRRIVCLLDGEVVPIVLGPVTAGNETEGHKLEVPNVFSVSSCADWEEKLEGHRVVANFDKRMERIAALLYISPGPALSVVQDPKLLEEVAGLVEWPTVLMGKIDENFMSLPPEVRELSMKINQKYFALRDAAGQPAPFFAFVANLEAPDGGKAIIAGNERVLRARLADARHFWDLDLKTPLRELLPKLDGIVFHARIGTQRQRAERIGALAREISERLGADGQAVEESEWAGRLCKADLVTGMVGEFPELQGIMGGYYAEKNPRGWNGTTVGPAIKTHYQPKGPTDDVPHGIVPVSVALADKIDTLREFFRIGEVPTGSGDPYALRRAALGVIRIILENELTLPLGPLLNGDEKLFAFLIERLRVKLRGEGKKFDVLDAVLGAQADDDLLRTMRRVEAVTAFLETPDGQNLLTAYRRAANILKIEDAKDGPHTGEMIRDFAQDEERNLATALSEARDEAVIMFQAGCLTEAMAAFARLRGPVDEFFNHVTVNTPDSKSRLNRLRLLALLRDTMHQIADFSKIQN